MFLIAKHEWLQLTIIFFNDNQVPISGYVLPAELKLSGICSQKPRQLSSGSMAIRCATGKLSICKPNPYIIGYNIKGCVLLQGVLGYIIVNQEGLTLRSTCEVRWKQCSFSTVYSSMQLFTKQYNLPQPEVTDLHAQLIPQLAKLAQNMVRDLDPQVQLSFCLSTIQPIPYRQWSKFQPDSLVLCRTILNFFGYGPRNMRSW